MLCSNKNSFTETESQTTGTSFLRLKTTVTNIIHKSVGQVHGSADTGQAWLILVRLSYVSEVSWWVD